MNHQPYDSWILEDEPIERSQQVELEEHLKECPKCSSLHESWMTAKAKIKTAPVMQPKAGFADRWQQSLAERRKAEERRQSRNLILWLTGSALLVLIIFAIIFVPDFSLISLVVTAIHTMVNVSTGISELWDLLYNIVRSLPTSLLIVTCLFFSTLISVVSFVWGISLWKMSLKGVKENENN